MDRPRERHRRAREDLEILVVEGRELKERHEMALEPKFELNFGFLQVIARQRPGGVAVLLCV
jgi:hypothetical protein